MRIIIDLQGFTGTADELDELARIVFTVIDSKHDWLGPDPEHPRLATYFEKHPHHLELIEKSYTAAQAYGPKDSAQIQVRCQENAEPAAGSLFPLRTARRYLEQPLRLFVENGIADGSFLVAAIAVVDDELARQLALSPSSAIDVSHGGGKPEIVNHIKASLAKNVQRGFSERIMVIVDSDARYPGHEDQVTGRMKTACQQGGISLHLLRKRAIENYMPDRLLDDYAIYSPDVEPAVAFVKKLSSQQRDHYPMKAGLSSKAADGERQLYGSLVPAPGPDDEDVHTPGLRRLMDYCLSEGLTLSLADLSQRNALAEVQAIVSAIKQEL